MNEKQMKLFSFDDEKQTLEDNNYTAKINIPQYEMHGLCPNVLELCNMNKYYELIWKIDRSNISEEQKKFLKLAATRHLQFNYSLIAEYYAHQDKEMQELMEDSALVIIDFNDAIAKGYTLLMDKFSNIEEEDLIWAGEDER